VLDGIAAHLRVLGEQLTQGGHSTQPPGPYSAP
jgi:hypothetical protein